MSKVSHQDNHWIWTGTHDSHGYGVIKLRGKQWKAHRLVWYICVGEPEPDLVVDHKCSYKDCVNPKCLREIDNVTNVMIGNSPQAVNARKKTCPLGHEYAVRGNSLMAKGWQRYCPTCNRYPVA